jgi:fructuronate reductase
VTPQPSIAREKLSVRWVHIGNGHFFRGHQIYFNDLAIEKTGTGWGCAAINLRDPNVSKALTTQDNLYTIATEKSQKVMGSLLKSLHIAEAAELCFKYLLSQETEVISLTITEKGYRENEPAIRLLIEICEKRLSSHKKGLVFLSCDNLQNNGQVLKTILLQSAKPQLAEWIQTHCFFPSSMVDRIVPHFSMAELKEKEKAWGYFDPVAIFTEDFAQWIIEDNFGGHKPNWQSAGVQFVKDVKPFERIKLQVLNASHSWLAYRGLLKGHEFVADCMADQELSSELSEMINSEIGPLLDIPTGFDLLEYKEQMFGRFRNPSMRHRLSQIAMDGTQKIPQRFTPNLSAQSPLLLKGLAAWLKYIQKNNFIFATIGKFFMYRI